MDVAQRLRNLLSQKSGGHRPSRAESEVTSAVTSPSTAPADDAKKIDQRRPPHTSSASHAIDTAPARRMLIER